MGHLARAWRIHGNTHSFLDSDETFWGQGWTISAGYSNRLMIQFAETQGTLQMHKGIKDNLPLGFKLRHTLKGHRDIVTRIAWSPDGRLLASPSEDQSIRIWDLLTGEPLRTLEGHLSTVFGVTWSIDSRLIASGGYDGNILVRDIERGEVQGEFRGHSGAVGSIAWSPDGLTLASGGQDETVRLWITFTQSLSLTLRGHSGPVYWVAWSPDGNILASASADKAICLWDAKTGDIRQRLEGHADAVLGLAWLPNRQVLVSCSMDRTIRIWDLKTGRQISILEGHTGPVTSVSCSFDEKLIGSKSTDGTVRIWHGETCASLSLLDEPMVGSFYSPSLAFHPKAPLLATLGEHDTVIRVWELDVNTLLRRSQESDTTHYSNAKIVLVGDTAVGKTGLSLVLTGRPFEATESTHGRHVWTFERQNIENDGKLLETREALLWDLAGQPGYRLIHQLHLNEVAVALVVFDARSETDPFAGVRHWDRALKQAQRIQGGAMTSMKKFLVAARADRGRIGVSSIRIRSIVEEFGFSNYFETSAKEGWNISELADAIRGAIDWDLLPKVSSNILFEHIKSFLIEEKKARMLSTVNDLYRGFVTNQSFVTGDISPEFQTCIGRVESRGLLRRLSFGGLILLTPELLDSYASAIINAAKDEPDGLGYVTEDSVRSVSFRMPEDERVQDKEQEKLLLIATIEDLLRHEIALREQGEDGPYLVFPSQLTRENPDLPDPTTKSIVYGFEGPILNIYATLAVRIAHSEVFKKKEMWKNAIVYMATVGGTCGMFLQEIDEGRGELTLFFDPSTSEETRFQFEEYIHTHLERRALPNTIRRRRVFRCQNCDEEITERQVNRRRDFGYQKINCPVCGTETSLLDREQRLTVARTSLVSDMDRAADAQRERETFVSIIQGKVETTDFDVFLCHNTMDKIAVKEIGSSLKECGILPWLDEWELRPGFTWQDILESQISKIKSAAVFIGRQGIGPWQSLEQSAFLREFIERKCPVIPVILRDCNQIPSLPVFLKGMTWVDFRQRDPDPFERLIWGITGRHRHDA